jgi:hypothetical protein
MRKLSEYKKHAEECRKMAATMKDPEKKKQLQEMVEAWEMLARERLRMLEKNGDSERDI